MRVLVRDCWSRSIAVCSGKLFVTRVCDVVAVDEKVGRVERSICGKEKEAGDVDGVGEAARFGSIWGSCAVPKTIRAASLVLTDWTNGSVRLVDTSSAAVRTIANKALLAFAGVVQPAGVVFDADGRLLVSDGYGNAIVWLSASLSDDSGSGSCVLRKLRFDGMPYMFFLAMALSPLNGRIYVAAYEHAFGLEADSSSCTVIVCSWLTVCIAGLGEQDFDRCLVGPASASAPPHLQLPNL